MALPTSSLIRFLSAVALLCVCGTAALVRGQADLPTSGHEQKETLITSTLAVQLDALLTARFSSADKVSDLARRRSALIDLSTFAAVTADGLLNAAPSGEARIALQESLAPVLAWHQDQIAAAISALPNAEPAQPKLSGSRSDTVRVSAAP
jgi:hypothetical protein